MTIVLLTLGLIAATLAAQGLVLLAHHLQRSMGSLLLGAVTGVGMFTTVLFSSVAPILHLPPHAIVPLLSVILYVNLLAAVLVVYVCDGTNHARRLILMLLATFALTVMVQELIRLLHPVAALTVVQALPEGLLRHSWRISAALLLAQLVSFSLLIFLYQLLTNSLATLPRGARLALVLALVFVSDGVFFTVVAFAGQPHFGALLAGQVLAKLGAATLLAPGYALYITRVLREQAGHGWEERPVFDVVARVTEMDREMKTIMATMVEGLILCSTDGTVVRANASAERLLGRKLAGLRLDDPVFRMTYPDGTRFPLADSPLAKSLRERKPVENVELGLRQEDGSVRIFSVNASPILDSQNRMRGALATFRDITQRRQIDEHLAASQDFLKRLIDQAPTGIAVFDREGVAEHLNKAFLEFIGAASPNELIGRLNIFKDRLFREGDLLQYYVQAYKGRVVQIPPKCIDVENMRVFDLEGFSFASEAGEAVADKIKVVSHHLFPVYDRLNKVVSVVALVNDLTEYTRAEQRRRVMAERYQDMVSRISDFLFSARVVHGSLEYEFLTPAVEKVTGYPEEFFLNDNWFWFTIIDAEDKQRVQNELLKLFSRREGQEGVIEYRLRARRGGTRWVQTRFTILRNAEGEVERLIGAVSDISARKEAEDALRKTVSRFRALVENIQDLVVTIDLQGKITFANQTFHRVLAQGARTLLGNDFYRYLHADDRETAVKRMQELIATEKPVRKLELRLLKSMSESVWLVVNADPVHDETGVLNGIILVATDITERKRAEEAVRRRTAELTLLSELSRAFRGPVPIRELVQLLYEMFPTSTGWTAASLWLWQEQEQRLVMMTPDRPCGDLQVIGDPDLVQRCFTSGQAVVIPDCTREPGRVGAAWAQAHGVKATAAVPLQVETQVVGALQVSELQDRNGFDETRMHLLSLIARQFAHALIHAQNMVRLQQAEIRCRTLMELAGLGVFRATTAGRLLTVNPALLGMLGYTDETELLSRDLALEVFEKAKVFTQAVGQLEQQGVLRDVKVVWRRADGTPLRVRLHLQLEHDGEGRPDRMTGYVQAAGREDTPR